MVERKIEIIGIKVRCNTCEWSSRDYFFSEEGGRDCALTSAVIETRLGHVIETALIQDNKIVTHEVNLVDIFKD